MKSLLVAVWLLLAVPAGSFAAAPAVSGDSDQSWSLVLEALDRQDKIVRGRLAAFNARRAAEAASFAAEQERLLRDRARLALWQATATDPWEIRTVLAGIARLRQDVDHLAQRPQQTWAALEQNVALLESYRGRLAEITRHEIPDRFRDALAPVQESIAELSQQVVALRDGVAAETAPLRDLSEQLDDAESELQAALAPAWKTYYTDANPTIFSSSYPRYVKRMWRTGSSGPACAWSFWTRRACRPCSCTARPWAFWPPFWCTAPFWPCGATPPITVCPPWAGNM